ncbi:MAG: hypothetical protein IJR63_08510 [Synergistaceae bacterium]|nr:hypothetical protein [Synergistaceae bacterium]
MRLSLPGVSCFLCSVYGLAWEFVYTDISRRVAEVAFELARCELLLVFCVRSCMGACVSRTCCEVLMLSLPGVSCFVCSVYGLAWVAMYHGHIAEGG